MRYTLIGALVLLFALGAAAFYAEPRAGGQERVREFFGRRAPATDVADNVRYDGRLAFVRIRFTTGFAGMMRRGSRGEVPWAHDYPTADTHLMKIIDELTLVRPHVDESNVFALDDKELHQYPIAYMSEPGFWTTDDDEAKGLRNYLLKGGFIIFDDFREQDWYNLEEQMRRVLPDAQWVELDSTHPIFHAFFEITDLTRLKAYSDHPTYWGIFEGNDRRKRLMAIANRDGDLGEYWEFSDTGLMPVDDSNQAYKFGVNYFIYGLTH